MRALILGGYGFIGLEIARRIIAAGHEVTGLGRSANTGRHLLPAARWISADIATLDTQDAWRGYLEAVDVVVNAAGALQSGLKDDVKAIHHTAIVALVSACEAQGVRRFVQISAAGATTEATTEFMRSKARADSHLRSSSLDWIILHPGLVIGPNAYGGTALIRMIASVPLVQPIVFGDRLVQTVALSDLADVVLDAVDGDLPAHSEFDLVEEKAHTLRSLVQQFRAWLGVAPARMHITVPEWLAYGVARVADALGYLGWRSPMRTTMMRVLSGNVVGEPEAFRAISSLELSNLTQTLAKMPSTLQERWFARLYLVMPAIVAVLALFWVLSGLVAMFKLEEASAFIGVGSDSARWAVICGAIVDVGLGGAILYRPWARSACWGMAAVTLFYLAVGTTFRPDLWADPLGPLLKTLPALMLAVTAAVLLEER